MPQLPADHNIRRQRRYRIRGLFLREHHDLQLRSNVRTIHYVLDDNLHDNKYTLTYPKYRWGNEHESYRTVDDFRFNLEDNSSIQD